MGLTAYSKQYRIIITLEGLSRKEFSLLFPSIQQKSRRAFPKKNVKETREPTEVPLLPFCYFVISYSPVLIYGQM
jgi:hypothetical protein